MTELRVITLKDGRRIKEVREFDRCTGCMFRDLSSGCNAPRDAVLEECSFANIIYQPAEPDPVAYLWRHAKTGQTRVVETDCVITTQPGGWKLVGPLALAQPEPVKRQPLTLEERRAVFAAAEERVQESSDLRWFDAIVEEVERAYGIRQQDGGAT